MIKEKADVSSIEYFTSILVMRRTNTPWSHYGFIDSLSHITGRGGSMVINDIINQIIIIKIFQFFRGLSLKYRDRRNKTTLKVFKPAKKNFILHLIHFQKIKSYTASNKNLTLNKKSLIFKN